MYCKGGVCSISRKFSLHMVYIFKNAWNILTKFWYCDQIFSGNVFWDPYAKVLKHLHMRSLRLLFYTYYWQIPWHDILRIPFDKWGHKMTSQMWLRYFSSNFLQFLSRNINIWTSYKVYFRTKRIWQKENLQTSKRS